MTASNLPAQPTSFVGRTRELDEVIALLNNPDCRLVTLVGPGGMGKTRLSLEVGARLSQRGDVDAPFKSSGVYFVALQPINSPDLILSAVAEAVGIQFYAGGDVQDQLLDYLRPHPILLIMDNAEHLLDGIDRLSFLLDNAPLLKLIVTSRETLNLREEWLYPLAGMRIPDRDDAADAESYSAVRLFAQSARRARPDFSLTADLGSVLRICRQVEGMPLALEMTAAWLRRLPASEIARELERGLDILESSARNAPARHHSVRTVFDQSWALLSETEQDVFKKLSIFRGGFRREAAEVVARATLGILSALVDKSLLSVDADGRYSLHELVRQYAEERLNAMPDVAAKTHNDHAAYFMRFLKDRYRAVMLHMSRGAVNEITADLKNIRVAMDWMLGRGVIGRFNAAINCLMLFYQFRCLYEEGKDLSGRVVEQLRHGRRSITLGRMLVLYGWMIELSSRDYPRAIALLEEAQEIGQSLGYPNFMEGTLRISDIATQMGDYERARQLAQECVDLHETEGEFFTDTFSLAHLGYVLTLMGDYGKAKELITDAIRIARKYDVPSGVCDAENYLGQVELALCECQQAKQTFEANVALSKQSAYLKGTTLALIGAAEAAKELGENSEARRYLSEALTTARDSNQIPYVLAALDVAAALLMQTDQRERAADVVLLVLDHRAATHETRSRAVMLFEQLKVELSGDVLSAALDRARSSQIETLVAALLDCELAEEPTTPQPITARSMPAADSPLTEREVEILRLIADGLSNREIAEQLFLTVGTIKWYLSEIYSKMYVVSRTQAIARARELRLID